VIHVSTGAIKNV